MSTHTALSNDSFAWNIWRQTLVPLTSADTVLSIANQPWVATASETQWPMSVGAQVLVAPAAEPTRWWDLLNENRISVVCLLPSELAALCAERPSQSLPSTLRAVFCGGEMLPCALAESFLRRSTATLVHFYAPTAAAPVLWSRIDTSVLRGENVPLGQPAIPGRVQIISDTGRPTPTGVVGRIALFAHNNEPLQVISDKGRLLRNGNVEFVGTVDGTIWLRGQRVDLVAIERKIRALPEIVDCYLAPRSSLEAGPALVAWIVPSLKISGQEARVAVERGLPTSLQPSALVTVTALPLMRNGEIDTSALDVLPILDVVPLRAWQRRLEAVSGVSEVAVICANATIPLRPVLQVPEERLEDELNASVDLTQEEIGKHDARPFTQNGNYKEEISNFEESPLIVESHGEDLLDLSGHTLSAALIAAAEHAPTRGIHFLDSSGAATTLTYAALLAAASRVLGGLRRQNGQPGETVILQLGRQDDFLIGFWACILGGMVPVPIAPPLTYTKDSAAARKIVNVWEMLGRPRVLAGSEEARGLTALFGLSDPMSVSVLSNLMQSPEDLDWYQSKLDELALLLLTSGSTGMPKAVMHSHRTLLARCDATCRHRGYTEHDVSLNWLPLDHVGAIIMFHLRDVVLNCEQFHAPTEFVLADPLRWLAWIDRWRVTVTWAPNFAFALINARADHVLPQRWDLSCLRVVINAGEAIVPRTARRFIELLTPLGFPASAMKPEWGMSETSSAVTGSTGFTLEATHDDDAFADLGLPLPGTSLRIVDARAGHGNAPSIGRLHVRGCSVTLGYYRNESATSEAFTTDGWFDTGDLGYLNDGRLTIVGRAKDSVIINGVNYYSHEIEAVVETIPGIAESFTAACAYRPPEANTDELMVFFVRADATPLAELAVQIRAMIGQQFGLAAPYLIPVESSEIPKTAIGKIQRAQLRARFEAGEFARHLRLLTHTYTKDSLPDDFAMIAWLRAKRPRWSQSLQNRNFLIVGGGKSVSQALQHELEVYGHHCIDAGSNFVEALAQTNHVLYLSPLERQNTSPSPDIVSVAITELAKFLRILAAQRRDHQALSLVLITRVAVDALANDPIDCAHASLLAWFKSAAAELSNLTFRHIDVEDSFTESGVAQLVEEILSDDPEPLVALRENHRFVPRLTRIDHKEHPIAMLPLRREGFWLLAGGLGGIGYLVAHRLTHDYGAKLLIIGRRPTDDSVRAQLAALSVTDGDVIYASCDITDFEALSHAVVLAAQQWRSPLAGVFHMAAEGSLAEHWQVLNERGVLNENDIALKRTLDAKTRGSINLMTLLANDLHAPFIAFSSVTASFGAATLASYAAANAFLSAFCVHHRRHGRSHTYCLEWSMWHDTGLAADAPAPLSERTSAQGYTVWPQEQGIAALLFGLALNQPRLLIGITNVHPGWHARGAVPWAAGETVHGFVAPGYAVGENWDSPAIRDRFGRSVACEVRSLATLPRNANDRIDETALVAYTMLAGSPRTSRVSPRTEWERRLAGLWRELLHVEDVGIHDNFFELGGHSLLATQVISRIRSDFDIELPLRSLFETPCIEGLAKSLEYAVVQISQAPIRRTTRHQMPVVVLDDISE